MKKLERSRSDRILFGVCGGFAEYFAIDPDLVRVGWIVLILSGGVGVLPYVAAALLLPESSTIVDEPRQDRLGKNVGLALVALAAYLVFRELEVGWGTWWSLRFLVPVLLAFGGALLVWPSARAALGGGGGRELRRSVGNRVLAGVAGGIAEKYGTDPNLVRVLFVLAGVLTTGIAVVAYLVMIVLVPEERVDVPAAAPVTPGPAPGPGVPPPPIRPRESREPVRLRHRRGRPRPPRRPTPPGHRPLPARRLPTRHRRRVPPEVSREPEGRKPEGRRQARRRIKRGRGRTDEPERRERALLLKWIFNVLLFWVLYRLVRGLFRPRAARRVRSEPRRELDPDRAVDAQWSEVADEGAEGKP